MVFGFRSSLLAGSLLTASPVVQAQIWNGSTDGYWNTADNWTPGNIPDTDAAISFDGTGANLTTTTNSRYTLDSITFTAGQNPAVTINTTASPIAFTSGTAIRFNAGNNISVATGNHKIVGTGVANVANHDVIFNGTTDSTHTLDIASGASFEIQGRIHQGATTNKNYVKTGGGILILSGVNDGASSWTIASGKTFEIQQGATRFANTNATGALGNRYHVSGGAAFELDAGFTQILQNDLIINGTGIGGNGALRSLSGDNIITSYNGATGTIVTYSDSSIGVDSDTLTIKKIISGSSGLIKVGAGTLVLGGMLADNLTPFANTYTGTTSISGGTLEVQGSISSSSGINNNAALVFNSSSYQFFSNAIDGTGSLAKEGSGTLMLSGANSYSGGSTINDGTLVFQNTAAKPASGTHAFAAETTLGLGVSGASPFTAADVANAFTGAMTGNLSGITVDSTTNVGIDTSGGDFTFSNSISGSPARSLEKLGFNTLNLSGNNTYPGGTKIRSGMLQFAKTTSMPAAGDVSVRTGATLAVNAGGVGEFTNATSGNGSIGGLLAGQGSQFGGTVSYTGNVTFGIDTTNAGATLSYAGAISNVGTKLGLTKLGSGTLALTNANNCTGTTTISAGTLQLGDGGTTGSLAPTGAISIGTGATFSVNQSDTVTQGTDFGSVITGGGSFTQAGTGTTIITADNSNYYGTTTISAGTLQIGNGGTSGTLGYNTNTFIAAGAVLRIEQTGSFGSFHAGTLTGAGSVTIPASRRFNLRNNNQVGSGSLSFNVDGTLGIDTTSGVSAVQLGELTGTGIIGLSGIVVIPGYPATLVIGGKNTDSEYSGIIIPAALGIEKTGNGTLTLSGVNTYGGNTTVSSGTLTLGNANTGNDASTVTIASTGATLNLTYSGTDVVDKLYIGSTLMAAGVYGPSATPLVQIIGSGTLTVTTGPIDFPLWITGTFANGTVPPGERGPDEDPDDDGVSNFMEYAIAGQDPTVSNPTIGIFTANTLSFTKRAVASGLIYAIQESTDIGILDDWTEVSGGSYVNNSTTISYTLTPPTPLKNFTRLKVAGP